MSNRQKGVYLRDRFLDAVVKHELGTIEDRGVVVTLKQFKAYFKDIKSDYINSFLPSAAFEPGRSTVTHTKYLYRIRSGVYLVHPDVIEAHRCSGDTHKQVVSTSTAEQGQKT